MHARRQNNNLLRFSIASRHMAKELSCEFLSLCYVRPGHVRAPHGRETAGHVSRSSTELKGDGFSLWIQVKNAVQSRCGW